VFILRQPRYLLAALVAGALCLVPIASAQAADAPTITSVGNAQVKPKPTDPKSDASIRAAVTVAEDKALPLAIAEAKEYAGKLAAAAGLKLGALVSISNAPQNSGYPFGFFQQNGTFGNGKFCGNVRTTKLVTLKNGQRRRVTLKGSRRVCRVPRAVQASVSVTFAIAS
jgi:uncharacterized protein YggE